MLNEARRRTNDPAITYVRAAIEDFEAGERSFDGSSSKHHRKFE
jgi:hypothetical protein